MNRFKPLYVCFDQHQLKMALSGDIAKMYRQIALDEDDKDFHRILWRDSTQEPIKHLRMTRVTYCIASSSFNSIKSAGNSKQSFG